MKRFDPTRYYFTSDPELGLIATRGTLSQWRHKGEGPVFLKLGQRVLYRGSDLNAYLEKTCCRC